MKVVGVGLNKTGTKTLRVYLIEMGFKHYAYDLPLFNEYGKENLEAIFQIMDGYDSFEDWSLPLIENKVSIHPKA